MLHGLTPKYPKSRNGYTQSTPLQARTRSGRRNVRARIQRLRARRQPKKERMGGPKKKTEAALAVRSRARSFNTLCSSFSCWRSSSPSSPSFFLNWLFCCAGSCNQPHWLGDKSRIASGRQGRNNGTLCAANDLFRYSSIAVEPAWLRRRKVFFLAFTFNKPK